MKFRDDDSGEMVSRRELARRRDARVAERQQETFNFPETAQALTNLLRHGSVDGKRTTVTNFAQEPRRKPAEPTAPSLGLTAEEIPEAHRAGLVDFDHHPGHSLGPGFKYSLTAGHGYVSDQTMRNMNK